MERTVFQEGKLAPGLVVSRDVIGLPNGGARINSVELISAAETYGRTGDFYRINGVIRPDDPQAGDIQFQMGFPKEWNHRILQYGGGGLDGTVTPVEMACPGRGFMAASPLLDGYVICDSDSGHMQDPANPSDCSWALNQEALENYAHKALKKVRDLACYLVTLAYGNEAEKVYFAGGSNGGRECIKAIEEYPEDYDGAICLYPVVSYIGKVLLDNRYGTRIQELGEACLISSEKYHEIQKKIIAFQDGADGLEDGIVSDLATARANRAAVRRMLAEELSESQLQLLDEFATPYQLPFDLGYGARTMPEYAVYEGAPLYEVLNGYTVVNMQGDRPLERDSFSVAGADQILKCMVMKDPEFDPVHMDIPAMEEELQRASRLLDAYGATLEKFAARGGKVILLQGMADPLVSPYSTIQFYEHLAAVHGAERLREFLRFYLVPGYGHGFGEIFGMDVDLLTALDRWVCDGQAPAELVAEDAFDMVNKRTRPLYEYPCYPVYNGSGDVNRAESFHAERMEYIFIPEKNYSGKPCYDPKNDERFQCPVIDVREQRRRKLLSGDEASYQYFHGYFEGTNVKFSFYFPEKEKWQGRFFQHLSPFPGPDEELAALGREGEDDFIAFALVHGACYVESNMGSGAVFGSEPDSRIFYQSSAAVAEYCREMAHELYGPGRVYGVVYGGSGGGYKTMSCIENTHAWDGAVPYVIGSPMSLPNCLTVCAHGSRLLRHCCQRISDALEPGGSGDIYAGLNEEEEEALRELVQIGFPPRLCSYLGSGDDGSLPVLLPVVKMMDPEYFTDFWTKPGYLGAEPDGNAQRDRIYMRTKVVWAGFTGQDGAECVIDDRNGTDDAWQKMMTDASAAWLEVEDVPVGEDLYLRGVDILFETGEACGKKLRLGRVEGNRLVLGSSYGVDNIGDLIDQIAPGDEILLDNSDYIAVQTYHRHQVPEDRSFHAWDQYRDESGTPIYPQRRVVIGYGFTAGGCGSVQDGHVQGKVIIMNNLADGDFPWQADWYRRKIEEVYGEGAEDCMRLWYNDNAPHGDVNEVGDNLHIVSYLGMLRQAILDVADWAQYDRTPVATTGYQLVDNQVYLADTPEERGGVQPMVELRANGEKCAQVKIGEEVKFTARIQLPPAAGELVRVEWSFEGEQDFPYSSDDCTEASHTFSQPGCYYVVVRVVSDRHPELGYTKLRNLDRACVIVTE